MQSRRCTKCQQEPSGLIPRVHEFCEYCGAPLSKPEAERVTATCYRCGEKFETVAGVTICAPCQQLPAVEAAPLPEDPENHFLMSAIAGAVFPLAVRIGYGLVIGPSRSPESRAMAAVLALVIGFGALLALGVVLGLALGLAFTPRRKVSAGEQAISLAAFAATVGALYLLT